MATSDRLLLSRMTSEWRDANAHTPVTFRRSIYEWEKLHALEVSIGVVGAPFFCVHLTAPSFHVTRRPCTG